MCQDILKELIHNKRNLIKVGLDVLTLVVGITLGIILRFQNNWLQYVQLNYYTYTAIIFILIYLLRKIGVKSWSFTSSLDVLEIIMVNIISFFVVISIFELLKIDYIKTIMFLGVCFALIFQLGLRLLFRINKSYRFIFFKSIGKKRALIFGAGEAGINLLRDNLRSENTQYNIVGLIDDDRRKIGTYIEGVKVISNSLELVKVIQEYEIEVLIIAIPNIKRDKLKEVLKGVSDLKELDIKILPSLNDILLEESMLYQVRDINITDLLGRDEIQVNNENISELIKGKVVFVTGGAGSIGSELIRQIVKHSPKQLIGIDFNENELYFLKLEINKLYKDVDFKCEICNIREKEKVEYLFNKYKPNIVFHAAAHKHVPLMEYNPEEAIKNNIFGTYNVGKLAIKYGIDRFVLISTDKAVNPTNIMGATKRGCEIIIEELNKKSSTKFMAVRFGNVLGSNGSVIPIFKKLLSEGRNLTVTHKDITRYFMTIPEATQLVIEAGAIGKGGELFVLDMGEPVKIMDLAKAMIRLSNANVGIDVVGLRPGEKLYEELLYDVTKATKTENNKIFITKIDEANVDVDYYMEILKEVVKYPDTENIKKIMKEFVATYKETNEV